MVPHPQDYEILKYSSNMWVNRELCPWPPSTQERNTHRMKRVAPSAHMSTAILPSPPIKTSGAGGEREREGGREGGREGKEGEYEREGGKGVTMCVVILSPRYPGVLLHISAVSRLPRKHPNPPSESLTCLPSGASSSRFSGYGRGSTTVHRLTEDR